MGLTFKIKKRIHFPETFDFSNELVLIARKIVIPLIKEGMKTNTSITGKRFPELESSTKKSKQRRRGHTRPLFDENKLINSFAYKKRGRNKVIVYIKNIRKEIAEYLQLKGVGRRRKKFEFFGITEGMERDAMKLMERKLIGILKR